MVRPSLFKSDSELSKQHAPRHHIPGISNRLTRQQDARQLLGNYAYHIRNQLHSGLIFQRMIDVWKLLRYIAVVPLNIFLN